MFDFQELVENPKNTEHSEDVFIESPQPKFPSRLGKINDKIGTYLNDENNMKRVIFGEKFSLPGKTYGTSTFENSAKEGSPRYQDLWLKNPRNPFAVTSVHSLSQNISDKLDEDKLKTRLSSCINLSKKTSGIYSSILSESQQCNSRLYDNLSNHASASSSFNKLSDISSPRYSSDCLRGDGSKTKFCNVTYHSENSNSSDHVYTKDLPNNGLNVSAPPGNKLLFKSARKSTERIGKSAECLEKIRKCLEDLEV